MGGHFGTNHTVDGYINGQVTSALQKAIRRSNVDDALFWASEMDLSGNANYLWKRLRVIASEDIGIADNMACVQVRALYENWKELRNDYGEQIGGGDDGATKYIMHAVMILANAPKSRIVDHAAILMYNGDREKREIPDYALDMHTDAGREMGRGVPHFFDEASRLAPTPTVMDPYRKPARDLLTRPEGYTKRSPRKRSWGPPSPQTALDLDSNGNNITPPTASTSTRRGQLRTRP